MKDSISTSELMNYEIKSSNSNNYTPSHTSSNPISFPNLMENGLIVDYQVLDYTSEIIVKPIKEEV